MRTPVLAAAMLVATAFPAAAQIPDYDTEAYCRRVSSYGWELIQDKFDYCLRTEHSAFHTVGTPRHKTRSAKTVRCTYVASSAETGTQGSYGTFATCLKGRTGAERRRQSH